MLANNLHTRPPTNEQDLLAQITILLLKHNATVALAESCTGGLVMQKITSMAGSSRYFLGGVVAYSNEIKTKVLGVPADVLRKHGAVSEQTALAMARGAQKLTGATIGLSITGVAGPDGGTRDKPVGTVYIGLSSAHSVSGQGYLFTGDRHAIRQSAALTGLAMIKHYLENTDENHG